MGYQAIDESAAALATATSAGGSRSRLAPAYSSVPPSKRMLRKSGSRPQTVQGEVHNSTAVGAGILFEQL